MGALAPAFQWVPEDDLLLKNAVEDLQTRWHTLLYDPVVSEEASAHMNEIENSASCLLSKPNRPENSRENKCVSGKRKVESVRNCYYSLRKRICNEPFHSMDQNSLVGAGHNSCFGNGDEVSSACCMCGGPRQLDSNFDMTCHAFPEIGTDTVTSHAFDPGFLNQVEQDIHFAENIADKQMPHTLQENFALATSFPGVQELNQPKEAPVVNLFEANDLEPKPPVASDQRIDNKEEIFPGFGDCQVTSSPNSDCGASLHNLGYPPYSIPIWRMVEGLPASTTTDVPLNANELDAVDVYTFIQDGNMGTASTSRCDVIHLNSKQKGQMPCDNPKNLSPSPTDYLRELSNTLLNFTSEDELIFTNADGKDGIGRSYIDGFRSLLLDFPNGDIPNIAATEAAGVLDNYLTVSGGEHHGESDGKGLSQHGDAHAVCNSESLMLACPAANSQIAGVHDGVICCTLNTEDTEIPSNDDVFPSNQMFLSSSLLSVTQLKFNQGNDPTLSFVKDFSDNQKSNVDQLIQMKIEQKNPEHSHLYMRGPNLTYETGSSHLVGDPDVKFELPSNDCMHLAFKIASNASQGPCKIIAGNESTTALLAATIKPQTTELEQAKHLSSITDSYLNKQGPSFDGLMKYAHGNAISSKEEAGAPAKIQNQKAYAELSSVEMTVLELASNQSPENQEELPSESDYDVPHFSDVEAMIPDIHLSPDDQDLYSNKQVSKYQDEDSQRAIVRLEQAACSFMQRAIASRGALAVLYGRRSKFYIKKSEVLLGRATEDIDVDIDLGREGNANKISRRQAIIKLDQNGSFHLNNLGKSSMFVNDKEIAPKQGVGLTSNCLIEVRGMQFIFETSQTCVKQYMDRFTKGSQA
ncbi:uncharacterized protein LOC127807619 isoform X2 [Diospyros lotus]|uniref:uncharacterized protein LOC127807619 isoform X2 n=1 Tax=Diospyros lotus TaxID=55363 RepID=UPI002258BD0B|nr:uncharacterized protein LOC127807619 isoform X2 [Diospyros lotus]